MCIYIPGIYFTLSTINDIASSGTHSTLCASTGGGTSASPRKRTESNSNRNAEKNTPYPTSPVSGLFKRFVHTLAVGTLVEGLPEVLFLLFCTFFWTREREGGGGGGYYLKRSKYEDVLRGQSPINKLQWTNEMSIRFRMREWFDVGVIP